MNIHPTSARSSPLASCRKPNVPSRLRTPIAKAILALAAASGLMVGLPGQAGATVLTYEYKTILTFRPMRGTEDTAGLMYATADFKVDVDSDARYVADPFGGTLPAVYFNDDATVTISGASVATNNRTYTLGQLLFLPSVGGTAGAFTAAGDNPSLTLAGQIMLSMNFRTDSTAHGANAQIGDLIDPLDFAPTTSRLQQWFTSSGAYYRQNDYIITASLPATSADSPPASTAVPEPASIALFGIGSVAALGAVRRRRTV